MPKYIVHSNSLRVCIFDKSTMLAYLAIEVTEYSRLNLAAQINEVIVRWTSFPLISVTLLGIKLHYPMTRNGVFRSFEK